MNINPGLITFKNNTLMKNRFQPHATMVAVITVFTLSAFAQNNKTAVSSPAAPASVHEARQAHPKAAQLQLQQFKPTSDNPQVNELQRMLLELKAEREQEVNNNTLTDEKARLYDSKIAAVERRLQTLGVKSATAKETSCTDMSQQLKEREKIKKEYYEKGVSAQPHDQSEIHLQPYGRSAAEQELRNFQDDPSNPEVSDLKKNRLQLLVEMENKARNNQLSNEEKAWYQHKISSIEKRIAELQ
jgi:hypothetical protein